MIRDLLRDLLILLPLHILNSCLPYRGALLMLSLIKRCGLLLLLLIGSFATLPAHADRVTEALKLTDHVLGKADAPITIIEYASLTCSHCAQFQTETLPQLKEHYIDTGKVKLIFRDYPLDGTALRAAAVARCMPESGFHAYIGLLFKNQAEWALTAEPLKKLAQYAKLGGLSNADVDACANSDKLMDAIAAARLQADKLYQVQSTPSFIFNGDAASKITGALPYPQFAAKLDALLAALPKK
jgi:protein-disulfide isomerase